MKFYQGSIMNDNKVNVENLVALRTLPLQTYGRTNHITSRA